MVQQIIERYEHFLRSRRLVKPEQVKFCGYWVRRFLCLARELGEPDFDACLVRFPALLSDSERRPDWQIAQARDAVRIYCHQFRQAHPKPQRQGAPPPAPPTESSVPGVGVQPVVQRMREELRLRRYSLKTEDSYLRWVWQFYGYREEVGLRGDVPEPTEVKSFLTHVVREMCRPAASPLDSLLRGALPGLPQPMSITGRAPKPMPSRAVSPAPRPKRRADAIPGSASRAVTLPGSEARTPVKADTSPVQTPVPQPVGQAGGAEQTASDPREPVAPPAPAQSDRAMVAPPVSEGGQTDVVHADARPSPRPGSSRQVEDAPAVPSRQRHAGRQRGRERKRRWAHGSKSWRIGGPSRASPG